MYDYRKIQPQPAGHSAGRRRDLTQLDYHELMALGRAERARVAADLTARGFRWLRRLLTRR